MRLRQAKKIMRNVQKYPAIHWVYGSGRIMKANNRMCRYYSAKDEYFKMLHKLSEINPLAVLFILSKNKI